MKEDWLIIRKEEAKDDKIIIPIKLSEEMNHKSLTLKNFIYIQGFHLQ